MLSSRVLAPAALVVTLALAGCSAQNGDAASTSQLHPASPFELSDSRLRTGVQSEATLDNPLKHIHSCDDVASVLDTRIEGLDAEPANSVDGWGVFCDWAAATLPHSDAQFRAVGVALAVLPTATATPDPETLVQSEGGTLLDDPWLSERGGVATTLTYTSGDEVITVTTARLPSIDATITTSRLGVHNERDAADALLLVQQLLL